MPLNIDWQQILLHLLNFVILFAGLWLLLYKPVKKFMNGRREKYEKMDADAEKKTAEAEEKRAEYEKKTCLGGCRNRGKAYGCAQRDGQL